MPDLPSDPFLPPGLAGALKALYELYAAAVQAGFNEAQAMHLVTTMLTAIMEKTVGKNG